MARDVKEIRSLIKHIADMQDMSITDYDVSTIMGYLIETDYYFDSEVSDRELAGIGVSNFKYSLTEQAKENDKTFKALYDKSNKAFSQWNDLLRKPHFENVKSKFIGCKNCGSSIATKYMAKRNACPVCGTDMRPKTVLDRIEKLHAKYLEVDKEYNTYCNNKGYSR